ncbi:MAG TPA: hypothetical protein VFB71_04905 [Ramlibacter sp.]|nr:hypothetical protein [Ramlibacter sp.]
MPEMQPSMPTGAAMPAVFEAAPSAFEDSDDALGCECAHPSLQIESWAQEARGAGDSN